MVVPHDLFCKTKKKKKRQLGNDLLICAMHEHAPRKWMKLSEKSETFYLNLLFDNDCIGTFNIVRIALLLIISR